MEHRERIRIAVDAPARAFADGAQLGLERLGYEFVRTRQASPESVDAQIVDDRRLGQAASSLRVPLILLTGRTPPTLRGIRPVARVPRRARLGDLYLALQDALEPRPRAVPRVDDAIPARCRRGDRTWIGAIRSISERGCLLQSKGDLAPRQRIEISFPLSPGGWVQIPAETRYRSREGFGIVFRQSGAQARTALRTYVAHRLTA